MNRKTTCSSKGLTLPGGSSRAFSRLQPQHVGGQGSFNISGERRRELISLFNREKVGNIGN